ncbi:helix-turn-helix domain-containing protein [Fusobacterium nucleatum]|uniref:helix-turn-helix domain-containing protein n=1 Tax=Fusobacterium nucleatum TaxID=851 RepID=UPI00235F73F4|nr:helix-turn-helix domain-containing protein [Fusobacterium nucleatum]WDD89077.1 helix-turn-helix domain-containing protein [Fusobacterium nucleatum]
MEIKKESFFTVQAFMVNELKLKGNELLIYAIIFGFSQAENQFFTGSLNYLASWCGISSKTTVKTILNNLIDKGLLEKEDIYKNGVKYCKYKALTEIKSISIPADEDIKNCNGISKIDTGYINNCYGGISKIDMGISEIVPNNIDIHIDNKIENIIDNDDDLKKIKQWFEENKIDFSKKHQDKILKFLKNNSSAYLLKIFQNELDILKSNPDIKNISAVFSYHLFNETCQINYKEVEKKEIEINSKKDEEIKNSEKLERTLNIFNNLPIEKQEEIENNILSKNNIRHFSELKKTSKNLFYKLIGGFIEQELKNIEGVRL